MSDNEIWPDEFNVVSVGELKHVPKPIWMPLPIEYYEITQMMSVVARLEARIKMLEDDKLAPTPTPT